MIKNCFKRGAEFERDVIFNGDKIATIKALSRNDRAEIEAKSATKELKAGEIVVNFNFQKMQVVRMKCAVKEWEFGEVTEENVSDLLDAYFDAIDEAIQKMESDFSMNRDDIVKNLKKQSG